MIFDFLQLCGGLILAFGYIPQIMQITKTKSVNDLNLKTFGLISIGVALMEIYAINLVITAKVGQMYLITNSLALAISFIICILIIKFRR